MLGFNGSHGGSHPSGTEQAVAGSRQSPKMSRAVIGGCHPEKTTAPRTCTAIVGIKLPWAEPHLSSHIHIFEARRERHMKRTHLAVTKSWLGVGLHIPG